MDINEWISDAKDELDAGLYVEFRASVETMLLVLTEVERLQYVCSNDGQAAYFRKYNRKAELVAELRAENALLKARQVCGYCQEYSIDQMFDPKCPECKGQGICEDQK